MADKPWAFLINITGSELCDFVKRLMNIDVAESQTHSLIYVRKRVTACEWIPAKY